MAKMNFAFKVPKDQRSRKPIITTFTADSNVDSELDLTNLFVNESCDKVPLNNRRWRCNCQGPRQQQHDTCTRSSWGLRLAIISTLLLLTSGQDASIYTRNSINLNNSLDSQALNISNNLRLSMNLTQLDPQNANSEESESHMVHQETDQELNRQNNKEEKMSGEAYLPSGINGVSLNRNHFIDGDNALIRQLREKTKEDSLQTIKMHILMRLNLKKLPNITKPISVPQNILENFYKKYNASLLNSMWRHDKSAETPRTAIYASGELFSEPIKKSFTDSSNNKHNKSKPLKSPISESKSRPPSSDDKSLFRENYSAEMQGDDPNVFEDYQFLPNIGFNDDQEKNFGDDRSRNYNIHDDNGEYESILSHISSIYVFPEQPHMRHNRKIDVFRFKFDTIYSDISFVTLHLYLRGIDWIRTNQPNVMSEIKDVQNKDIVVAVHRALRRVNTTNYTHNVKAFEFRHRIPAGLGQWVSVDLKPLFIMDDRQEPNKTQEIFIKGVEPWMKPLVVTTDSSSKNPLTVHIEIGSHKKHRRKRSVFLDCTENDHDMRCCRYPLKVNFTSFGWHFVVAPTSFDAYFCSGDCRVGYLEQYPHTHLAALTTSATPCCSPTKMSSLSLLYFDDNHNLVLSVIPNMSVEGCSCS